MRPRANKGEPHPKANIKTEWKKILNEVDNHLTTIKKVIFSHVDSSKIYKNIPQVKDALKANQDLLEALEKFNNNQSISSQEIQEIKNKLIKAKIDLNCGLIVKYEFASKEGNPKRAAEGAYAAAQDLRKLNLDFKKITFITTTTVRPVNLIIDHAESQYNLLCINAQNDDLLKKILLTADQYTNRDEAYTYLEEEAKKYREKKDHVTELHILLKQSTCHLKKLLLSHQIKDIHDQQVFENFIKSYDSSYEAYEKAIKLITAWTGTNQSIPQSVSDLFEQMIDHCHDGAYALHQLSQNKFIKNDNEKLALLTKAFKFYIQANMICSFQNTKLQETIRKLNDIKVKINEDIKSTNILIAKAKEEEEKKKQEEIIKAQQQASQNLPRANAFSLEEFPDLGVNTSKEIEAHKHEKARERALKHHVEQLKASENNPNNWRNEEEYYTTKYNNSSQSLKYSFDLNHAELTIGLEKAEASTDLLQQAQAYANLADYYLKQAKSPHQNIDESSSNQAQTHRGFIILNLEIAKDKILKAYTLINQAKAEYSWRKIYEATYWINRSVKNITSLVAAEINEIESIKEAHRLFKEDYIATYGREAWFKNDAQRKEAAKKARDENEAHLAQLSEIQLDMQNIKISPMQRKSLARSYSFHSFFANDAIQERKNRKNIFEKVLWMETAGSEDGKRTYKKFAKEMYVNFTTKKKY